MESQVCGVVRWEYAMLMCVLFVFSRSGIVFNPSTGAITDHSQSAKDIYPYFKSQRYVEDPSHQEPALILSNGLSKPGERVTTEILFLSRWDSNPKPLDRQSSVLPLSYHWPLSLYHCSLLPCVCLCMFQWFEIGPSFFFTAL